MYRLQIYLKYYTIMYIKENRGKKKKQTRWTRKTDFSLPSLLIFPEQRLERKLAVLFTVRYSDILKLTK